MKNLRYVLPSLTVVLLLTGSGAAAPGFVERELEVSSDGITLAATLVWPDGPGRHPACVVTHGSEPANRKSPFYQRLARRFAENGIAALIYDKRGVGESTGTYVEAPDLRVPAGDVLACIAALKQQAEIDPARLGVWGISQGGWVGPLAASMSSDIRFVIAVSGPGVSPLEQNLYDKANRLRSRGLSEEIVDEVTRIRRLVWTYMRDGGGKDEAFAAWRAAKDEEWFSGIEWNPPLVERSIAARHPLLEHFAVHSRYEPFPILASLEIPLLAIFGEADTIVPVEKSVAEFRRAFEKGGNRNNLTVKVFPRADHGIRVFTGSGRDYADGYWEQTLRWVSKVVRE